MGHFHSTILVGTLRMKIQAKKYVSERPWRKGDRSGSSYCLATILVVTMAVVTMMIIIVVGPPNGDIVLIPSSISGGGHASHQYPPSFSEEGARRYLPPFREEGARRINTLLHF